MKLEVIHASPKGLIKRFQEHSEAPFTFFAFLPGPVQRPRRFASLTLAQFYLGLLEVEEVDCNATSAILKAKDSELYFVVSHDDDSRIELRASLASAREALQCAS